MNVEANHPANLLKSARREVTDLPQLDLLAIKRATRGKVSFMLNGRTISGIEAAAAAGEIIRLVRSGL